MSQVGLTQKVLKFAFSIPFFKCACSKPRNFLLAERIAWSRDQMRVQPLLKSPGEKQVDS
jgi:hypothetical protein